MNFDQVIYKKKTFASVLETIHTRSIEKEDQIKALISGLKVLVVDTQSALVVVPLIKEYLDVAIKNDDQLIKMAAIIQRCITSGDGGDGELLITEAEKEQLMKAVQQMDAPVSKEYKSNEIKPQPK